MITAYRLTLVRLDWQRRVSNPMNSTELLNYQLSHGIIKQETYDKYINSGIDTNWEDYFFKMTHRLIKPTYLSKVVVIKQCIMYPVHIIFKMV